MKQQGEFFVADLAANGQIRGVEPYDYATLERVPGCELLIGGFSSHLYRTPDQFEMELTHGRFPVAFRWCCVTSTGSAGVATIRLAGQVASVSLLATGLDEVSDQTTLRTLQTHLTRELHDTGFEPAFDLLNIDHRPLLATLLLADSTDETARFVIAVADRCFAASYFRYLQLA